jgi:hypothetical protein
MQSSVDSSQLLIVVGACHLIFPYTTLVVRSSVKADDAVSPYIVASVHTFAHPVIIIACSSGALLRVGGHVLLSPWPVKHYIRLLLLPLFCHRCATAVVIVLLVDHRSLCACSCQSTASIDATAYVAAVTRASLRPL